MSQTPLPRRRITIAKIMVAIAAIACAVACFANPQILVVTLVIMFIAFPMVRLITLLDSSSPRAAWQYRESTRFAEAAGTLGFITWIHAGLIFIAATTIPDPLPDPSQPLVEAGIWLVVVSGGVFFLLTLIFATIWVSVRFSESSTFVGSKQIAPAAQGINGDD